MPEVGLIMGSQSDWPVLKRAAETLDAMKISYEVKVVSAHRTPDRAFAYARSAEERGLKLIIAAAGAAAHLAGVMAGLTHLPVLGVPMESKALKGLDSLLSTVQMPGGIPVATFAIGEAGAKNAALFAAAMLALSNPELNQRLKDWRQKQSDSVPESPEE
jgi:5-(carboxyamino)imidazole ribonucleotide mutase